MFKGLFRIATYRHEFDSFLS